MKQKTAGYAALSSLLLGLLFFGVNLYLDLGRTGYHVLANIFFMLAIFCEMAFVVLIIIWVFIKTWNTEPARPGMQMPGPGGMKPGMPMMKAGMPMPGPAVAKKPPPPQA